MTWTYTLYTIFNPNPDDSEFCQICQNDNVPDVTNMSWQLSLSMTGTETWWRMFGTPPPDHVYQWAWSNYADTEDDNDRVKTWTSTILESTVIMMTTVTTMATMKMTTKPTILKSSPASDDTHGIQELLIVVPDDYDDDDCFETGNHDDYLGIQMGTTWGCLSMGFSSSRIAMSFSKVGAW